jgi:hypothetical protein
MVAHAAFNGVLTVAAVTATTSGAHLAAYQGLAIQVPGGWHTASSVPTGLGPDGLMVEGPGGAALAVMSVPFRSGAAPLDALLLDSARSLGVATGAVRQRQLPIGPAVEVDVTVEGQSGHLLALVVEGRVYELFCITGGSPSAERGWTRIVDSVSPAG